MATENTDKKYLDLVGLGKLVEKIKAEDAKKMDKDLGTATAAGLYKVGSDKDGRVIIGDAFTLPTVNDGQLKIQANGTDKGTFTANQSGNTTINITAEDLGLSQALVFVGVSTTDPSTGTATVSGHTTFKKGEVVLYKKTGASSYQEFVNVTGHNGTVGDWELLGDADSYALKTTTISAGGGLTGGGDLSQNRTISHATVTGGAVAASAKQVGYDTYGHVVLGNALVNSQEAAHNHSFSGSAKVELPDVTGTSGKLKLSTGTASVINSVVPSSKKLVQTSVVPAVAVSGGVIPAVANGKATKTVFGTDVTASKATAGTAKNFVTGAIASATCAQSFVTGAITSASGTFNTDAIKDVTLSTTATSTDGPAVVTAVGASTLSGTTTFNTDAIKSASCAQSFNTDAIKSATCAQSFTTEAYKAEYDSTTECLNLTAVTPTAVSISTAAATSTAVEISTAAASTGTVGINSGAVTTKYMKREVEAASTGSVTTEAAVPVAVSISTTAASTGSITPYSFEDVTVPVVSSNDEVDVAKAGTAVSVATVGTAVTVATGAIDTNGDGASVVYDVTSGNADVLNSASISNAADGTVDFVASIDVTGTKESTVTISGNTGDAGAHNHTIS